MCCAAAAPVAVSGALRSRPNHETRRLRYDACGSLRWSKNVMITCFIRCEIDPFKVSAFDEYARNWGQAISRCGAGLTGYFSLHEGSSTS
jgi:hypothetical protein